MDIDSEPEVKPEELKTEEEKLEEKPMENLEEKETSEELEEKAEEEAENPEKEPDVSIPVSSNPGKVRITKMSMHGFKSFADRVQIPLPGGFNVVCGPNGSGKSNIIDAACFVLGTLSGKRLRAENFKDLVFKGGKSRSGSKEASVSVFLEREKDGKKDEFVITRKINSSGDTQYKLNGKTVTRRRVVDILGELGVHPDGHNIIMQGDVTQLIEMSSEERRTIIDEVAGIAEFDEKKEKAKLELDKVEQKLNEAEIILEERRKALAGLEEQRKHAQRYRELQEHLKKLSASIFKKTLTKKTESKEDIEKKLLEFSQKLMELDEKLKLAEVKLEEAEKEMSSLIKEAPQMDNSMAFELSRLRGEMERKLAEMEGKRREIRRVEETIEAMRRVGKGRAFDEIIKLKKPGVYGSLQELIFVPEKYRLAIEVALGSYAHDIVVDTDKTAEECILHLKQNRLGRATFIPLNKIRPKEGSIEGEGVIGNAINLIGFDAQFGNAVKFALGDTVIVENISIARSYIHKARIVSLDGDLIEKSGLMKGGFHEKKEAVDISSYSKERDNLIDEIDKSQDAAENLRKKLEELENRGKKSSTDLGKRFTDLEVKKTKLRVERESLFQKKMEHKEKQQELEVKRASFGAEVEGLAKSLEDFSDVKEFYDKDVSELKKGQDEARREIMSLGSPNLRAIEEYELVSRVYEDLRTRVETIRKEKDSVFAMVLKIEERRKGTFMKAFVAINENFSQIFGDLTDGGQASIRLENQEDIKSGLEIKARHKGRRVIFLDAMSGGEKAITALAFLFSVLMYKGAPFYLMDEVDAALDRKNCRRISELIAKFSENSQFIVISHNDSTITSAHHVYGVSMEDGASKVMAIELPPKSAA